MSTAHPGRRTRTRCGTVVGQKHATPVLLFILTARSLRLAAASCTPRRAVILYDDRPHAAKALMGCPPDNQDTHWAQFRCVGFGLLALRQSPRIRSTAWCNENARAPMRIRSANRVSRLPRTVHHSIRPTRSVENRKILWANNFPAQDRPTVTVTEWPRVTGPPTAALENDSGR